MAAKRLCSVDGCGKPFDAKGYCKSHYSRFHRYGDPLKGRTSLGAPHVFLEGLRDVRSDDCIIWPFGKTLQGYGRIRIDGILKMPHVIVCEWRNGPAPDHHDAAHSCGKGQIGCVNPNHVRWKTRSENNLEKVDHGTDNRGERNPSARLTADAVREIRRLRGIVTQVGLGDRYGVTPHTIRDVQKRKTWKHVE